MHYRYLTVIVCIFCFSCSPEDEQAQPVISGLVGLWQGIIKSSSSGAERVTDISLKLNPERTFTLTKLSDRSTASGRYDDFPQLKALTLRVDDSNVTEFALTGGVKDYEYELHDGELLLNAIDGQVRLKKPDHDDSEKVENWSCSQSEGDLIWNLSIDQSTFILSLDKLRKDEASVFMVGNYTAGEVFQGSQELLLLVNEGFPKRAFEQLQGQLEYDQGQAVSLTLQAKSSSGEDLPSFECTQQMEEDN